MRLLVLLFSIDNDIFIKIRWHSKTRKKNLKDERSLILVAPTVCPWQADEDVQWSCKKQTLDGCCFLYTCDYASLLEVVSVCPLIRPSIGPSVVSLSIDLSVSLSIRRSVCWSVCWSRVIFERQKTSLPMFRWWRNLTRTKRQSRTIHTWHKTVGPSVCPSIQRYF